MNPAFISSFTVSPTLTSHPGSSSVSSHPPTRSLPWLILSRHSASPLPRPSILQISATTSSSSSSSSVSRAGRNADAPLRVCILGASGYTGSELVRLLSVHPFVEITVLTGERSAGIPMGEVFPQFGFGWYAKKLPMLIKTDQVDYSQVDVVFCCLPHATTQEIIKAIPFQKYNIKVIDLSADFRIKDVDLYEKWYQHKHAAPELQKDAVYGLVEIYREQIKDAYLVANPGCYPTAAQLSLIPLVKAKLISLQDIIVDAKSGVTGAGRATGKVGTLYCEVTDGMHAYSVGSHRHVAEIEQGVADAAGVPIDSIKINFTPHLIPMSRGIFESIYVKMNDGVTAADLKKALQDKYENEPFVHVLDGSALPQTRHVRGTNYVLIQVTHDRIPGRAIITAVKDNVVKGASGQAIQNMNIMYGFPEITGLNQAATFP